AVPITACWNAVVCWLIMREARIRAMGPSASRAMMDIVFAAQGAPLSEKAKTCALSGVASSIVRTQDLHPNLATMFREVVRRLGPAIAPTARLVADDGRGLDDTQAFLARLAKLDALE